MLTMKKSNESEAKADKKFKTSTKELHNLEAIVARSPVVYCIWRFDKECPMEYVSGNIAQWGYTPEDFIFSRISWQTVIHPEDINRIKAETISYLKKKVLHYIQNFRIMGQAGEIHWVESQNVFIYDSSGKISHAQSAILEITNREKAHQALSESESIYQAIFNNTETALGIADQDRNIILGNKKMEELTGFKNEELTGEKKRWDYFITPSDIELLKSNHQKRLADQSTASKHYECSIVTKSGNVKNIYLTTELIPGTQKTFVSMIDITDLKRAEKELKKSKEMLRLITENMSDMIRVTDMQGNNLYVSPSHFKGLGYRMEERVGKSTFEIVHPDDIEMIINKFVECLRENKPGRIEYRARHADGHYIWLETVADALRDDQGNITAFILSSRDISDQKRADDAMRENEAIFSSFLEHSPVYVFFKDKDIRSLRLSKNYEQLLGMPIHQALGKTMDELFPSDLSKKMVADDLRVLNEGKPVVVVEEFNGHIYETTKFPILKDGETIMMAGFTIDITERKQAETELARARDFVENVEDACCEMDFSGNLIFYNEAFLKTTGYTYDEYMALSRWDRHPTREEAKHAFKIYDNVYRTGIPAKNVEYKSLHKDGTTTIAEGSISLIRDKSGNPVGFRAIGRDITERKRAEEEKAKLQNQLLQSQKMESVGRLAGGVAHDFNNMLGVIIGHTDMAMDHMDPDQPLFANLMEIRKAAERSAHLTRQLLAFARKQTVSPKVLDVNETVDGMLKMLRRLIGEDIQLAWLPGINLWQVKIDPSQLDQILANLCVNARDAIEGVGKVIIETGNITFDEAYCIDHMGSVPGEYVLLAVSDDGCGMSKEILDKLFEPFFTTKGVGKGTGLGLSTIYGIVKQNNGFIYVYSESGQGTTFKIYLPRHIGKARQAEMEGQKEPFIGGQETVLVVEDEPAILALCKLMLESNGYQVLTAGMPGEAIRMAEEHVGKIHLLMTDVVMPEMNGRDLAKKMLSLYPDIKRLFMSGYTADVIAHRGILDEGVYFIQKPFSGKDLAAKVRAALDQK